MTMGRLIFAEGHIIVPYYKIATLATGLVVPLMVVLSTLLSSEIQKKIFLSPTE